MKYNLTHHTQTQWMREGCIVCEWGILLIVGSCVEVAAQYDMARLTFLCGLFNLIKDDTDLLLTKGFGWLIFSGLKMSRGDNNISYVQGKYSNHVNLITPPQDEA